MNSHCGKTMESSSKSIPEWHEEFSAKSDESEVARSSGFENWLRTWGFLSAPPAADKLLTLRGLQYGALMSLFFSILFLPLAFIQTEGMDPSVILGMIILYSAVLVLAGLLAHNRVFSNTIVELSRMGAVNKLTPNGLEIMNPRITRTIAFDGSREEAFERVIRFMRCDKVYRVKRMDIVEGVIEAETYSGAHTRAADIIVMFESSDTAAKTRVVIYGRPSSRVAELIDPISSSPFLKIMALEQAIESGGSGGTKKQVNTRLFQRPRFSLTRWQYMPFIFVILLFSSVAVAVSSRTGTSDTPPSAYSSNGSEKRSFDQMRESYEKSIAGLRKDSSAKSALANALRDHAQLLLNQVEDQLILNNPESAARNVPDAVASHTLSICESEFNEALKLQPKLESAELGLALVAGLRGEIHQAETRLAAADNLRQEQAELEPDAETSTDDYDFPIVSGDIEAFRDHTRSIIAYLQKDSVVAAAYLNKFDYVYYDYEMRYQRYNVRILSELVKSDRSLAPLLAQLKAKVASAEKERSERALAQQQSPSRTWGMLLVCVLFCGVPPLLFSYLLRSYHRDLLKNDPFETQHNLASKVALSPELNTTADWEDEEFWNNLDGTAASCYSTHGDPARLSSSFPCESRQLTESESKDQIGIGSTEDNSSCVTLKLPVAEPETAI